MASSQSVELKRGFMTKRSHMKSRLSSDNFKSRWFILYGDCLQYCEGTLEKGPGKEKGRVWLESVHTIEEANLLQYDDNKRFGFQIGYATVERNASSNNGANSPDGTQPYGQPLVLYVNATTADERFGWIKAVREACVALWTEARRQQLSLQKPPNADEIKFHPGIWTGSTKKYSCCEQSERFAPPCKPKTWHCPSYSSERDRREEKPPVHREDKPPIPLPRPTLPMPERVLRRVVALYDYKSNNPDDLDLVKNDEYEILDDTVEQYWWKARNKHNQVGFIPSNYVEDCSSLSGDSIERQPWFRKGLSRHRAEADLKADGREGCFLLRDSATTPGAYTLALLNRDGLDPSSPNATLLVRHYHIKQNANGEYYLSDKHPKKTIKELIEYHKLNSGGLVCRLRHHPAEDSAPATLGLEHGKYKLDYNDLKMLEELGKGNFGCVYKALYKGNRTVAVKMMLENAMQEDEFANEARNMILLRHDNLVQMYGFTIQPFYIVTEFMENGCLLNYLKKRRVSLLKQPGALLDMCSQVANAMKYLESQKFIHRDVAARNCLVGRNGQVKVGDFGLSRFVLDDEYMSSSGTKFPIKWASPEVLSYMRFSSKSDVWAFGILMWEIFTSGDTPYRRMNNAEVVDQVCKKNYKLDRPPSCPQEVYQVMLQCWEKNPEQRPSFDQLTVILQKVSEDKADCLLKGN